MFINIFSDVSYDVVFIILSTGLEQFAQLSAEELQPLDHVIHIGLLIEGTVAIRIVCKKSGHNRFPSCKSEIDR